MEILDKAIYGAIATILVAVVSGAVSVLVATQQTQSQLHTERLRREREVNISKIDVNNKQVTDFATYAINEDISVRLRLAEYLSIVTPSEDQRKRWKEYHDFLKHQMDKKAKELD